MMKGMAVSEQANEWTSLYTINLYFTFKCFFFTLVVYSWKAYFIHICSRIVLEQSLSMFDFHLNKTVHFFSLAEILLLSLCKNNRSLISTRLLRTLFMLFCDVCVASVKKWNPWNALPKKITNMHLSLGTVLQIYSIETNFVLSHSYSNDLQNLIWCMSCLLR